MDQLTEVVGVRGVLVKLGLGQPSARGFVAAVTVGVLAYAFRLPNQAFDDEGQMRPFKGLSKAPDATYTHFLAVPVAVGTAAFIFT